MIKITFVSAKSDDSQIPLSANPGGILAGFGHCVLLKVANPQPTLPRYYKLKFQANHGLIQRLVNTSSNTVNPKRIQNGLPF